MTSLGGPNPVGSFLKGPHFTFCLSVFDSRRGQHEGEEFEKVLSFFPTSVGLTVRTTVVGLAQAVTSFAETFTQDSDPCTTMEAESNRWIMYQCEPSIWMLMVINKAWVGPTCTSAAVRGYLEGLHSTFVLLHSTMSRVLEQDASAHALRRVLQPFLDEAGMRLLRPMDPRDSAALNNPLGLHRGLPLVSTSHRAFLSVQCLVNQLATTPFTGSRPVAGAMVLWNGRPLWSTLGRHETSSLFQLASRALVPLARAVTRGKALKLPVENSICDTLISPYQWQPQSLAPTSASGGGSSSGGVGAGISRGGTPRHPAGGDPAGLQAAMHGLGPHQRANKGANGGFLCPRLRLAARDSSHDLMSAALPMARVWLQDSGEWCGLLPYYRGPLLVLLLLAEGAWGQLSGDVLGALGEALAQGTAPLLQQLSAELPGYNLWHEPGHRYCLSDDGCGAARATPPHKATTLSSHAQRLVTDVQDKVDAWLAAAHTADGSGLSGEVNVCVRSCLDAWTVVRHVSAPARPGAHLVWVQDHPAELSLAAVSAKSQSLCDGLSPGAFSPCT